MKSETKWDHRWFGIWKESGPKYSSCPSIYSFIDPEVNKLYDVPRLTRYLDTAHVVATTSRHAFPCVITGEKFDGSLSCRTDGVWLWWDDLTHYIREHGLILPDGMLKNIENNNYVVPEVKEAEFSNLEWPPCW